MIVILRFFLLYDIVFLLIAAILLALFMKTPPAAERLARYLFLLPIGIGHVAAFFRNTIFYHLTPEMVGMDPSHFQVKIAFADLGLAIAAILAFRRSFSFCLGTGVFSLVFIGGLWFYYMRELLIGHPPTHSFWVFSTKLTIVVLLTFSLALWHRKIKAHTA